MKKVLVTLLVVLSFAAISQAQSPPPVHPSVVLSWTASPDQATNPNLGYNVYRTAKGISCPSSISGATWTKIASGIGSITYTDLAVVIDKYCYYVSAQVGTSESGPTNLAQAVLLPASPGTLQALGF